MTRAMQKKRSSADGGVKKLHRTVTPAKERASAEGAKKVHRSTEAGPHKVQTTGTRSAPAGAKPTARKVTGGEPRERLYKMRKDAERCNEKWELLDGVPPLVNEWVRSTEKDDNGGTIEVIRNVDRDDPVHGRAVYYFNPKVMKEIGEKKTRTESGIKYKVLWRRNLMTAADEDFAIYEIEKDGKRILAKLYKKSAIEKDPNKHGSKPVTREEEDRYRAAERARQLEQKKKNDDCQAMKLTRRR